MRPSPSVNSSTNARASRVSVASERSAGMSISTLKCPVLARIAPSLRRSMWLSAITCLSPVAVTKMSPTSRGRRHRHHLEAVHHGLERLHRVDLGDDHVRAEALGPHRDPAPAPAVAGDDERPTREQDVGRADDPVDRRLAGAVAVVEQVLRARLVDGDDREAELAVALQRPQPDDAGRRLLGPGDHVAELLAAGRVEDPDHVGAVVHRHVRAVVDRRLEVLVVRVVVLALDRERRDPVCVDERRGDVVLGRERVRGAEHDLGAARLERPHEVRGLGRDMEAGGDAVAGERLLALEALADRDRAPASAGRPTRCGARPRRRGRDP